MANRRKHFRYAISAPATFTWDRAMQTHAYGEGVTKDVSLTSSFVWSTSCPPAGVEVECEIFLPRVGASTREIKAVVEGLVARVGIPVPEHGIRGFVLVHRKVEIVERQTQVDALDSEAQQQTMGSD